MSGVSATYGTQLSTQGCPRAEEDRMGQHTLTFMEPQGADRKKIEEGHTSLRSRGTSWTESPHLSFLAVVQKWDRPHGSCCWGRLGVPASQLPIIHVNPTLETVAAERQFFYSASASVPIRQHGFNSASNCYVQTFRFVIVFDLSLVDFQFLSWEYM